MIFSQKLENSKKEAIAYYIISDVKLEIDVTTPYSTSSCLKLVTFVSYNRYLPSCKAFFA